MDDKWMTGFRFLALLVGKLAGIFAGDLSIIKIFLFSMTAPKLGNNPSGRPLRNWKRMFVEALCSDATI